MQDDLVALQQSASPIRNPFKVDFVGQWNKRKIVLKASDEFIYIIKPLRDHLARHLYMKVRYQFHDQEVAKLKAAGAEAAARKFRVSSQTENLIWRLITGEDLPGRKQDEVEVQEAADLEVLSKELSKVDGRASANGGDVIDVSAFLRTAEADGLAKGGKLKVGQSAHAKGTASLKGNKSASLASAEAAVNASAAPIDASALGGAALSEEPAAPDPHVIPADNASDFGNQGPVVNAASEEAAKGGTEEEGFAGLNDLDSDGDSPTQPATVQG